MSETGILRKLLDEISEREGLSLKDLTVLATQNDPFRFDTPGGHRDGEWLAVNVERLIPPDEKIHLRGLHYVLATDEPDKPNGQAYRNTDKDWEWVQGKAADAARWLGYIPFDRIIDQRNAAPTVRTFTAPGPHPYISAGVSVDIPAVDDIEPYVGALGFTGVQPCKLVLIGEKSSLKRVLDPIAEMHHADLYLPTGCLSDTLAAHMAATGKADGRPMVVLYFADCDPSGWNMGVEVARKLQAFEALGIGPSCWQVHRVALTPDQVREYGLPSTPLKATEKRADAWQTAMGVEQTEIDALAALQPDLLRRIASDAIAPFWDETLDRRVWRAYDEWRDEAQAALDDVLDPARLEQIRTAAAGKLDELREQIEEINQAVRIDPGDIALPPIVIPQADLDGRVYPLPLLDSAWPFAQQCRALKASKDYAEGGAP